MTAALSQLPAEAPAFAYHLLRAALDTFRRNLSQLEPQELDDLEAYLRSL